MISISRRQLILIAGAILLIAIIIAVVIELRRPTSTPPVGEVQIVDSFENEINNISISPGTINVSARFNEIKNYQEEVTIQNYNSKQITDDLIETSRNSLDVREEESYTSPNSGEIIRNTNGSKILTIYKGNGTFIYADPIEIQPNTDYSFDQNANVQEYRSNAEAFVRSMGINISKYTLDSTSYLTYPDSEPREVNNLSTAGLIQFNYVATANSYDNDLKVIDSKSSLTPAQIVILIDKTYTIRKATISIIGDTGSTTARLKTKTIEELIKAVENGEATLIESSFTSNTNILYTIVESAELMYYASNDRLIPVYVLDARLVSEDGSEGTGKLIVTAF